MTEISYRRHRFPPIVIQHAIWLYLRFTLNYRDVEDLLADRGLDISYETIQSWVLKFGPLSPLVLPPRLGRSGASSANEIALEIEGVRSRSGASQRQIAY